MARLFDNGIFSVIASGGGPAAGWSLAFFAAGTSTPVDAYSTQDDADAGANAYPRPIVIDLDGRIPTIWLNGPVKLILYDDSGYAVVTADNLNGGPSAVDDTRMLFTEISTTSIADDLNTFLTSGYRQIGKGQGWYFNDDTTSDLAASSPLFCQTAPNGKAFCLQAGTSGIAVEQGGAIGDGATDDRAAIQAAVAYIDVTQSRALTFLQRADGDGYALQPMPTSVFDYQSGAQPCVVLQPTTKVIEGGGATMILTAHSRSFLGGGLWSSYKTSHYDPAIHATIAANIAVGDTTITLSSGDGAKCSVGQTVIVHKGEYSFDKPEATEWYFANITAINGNAIVVDRPAATPLTLSSLTSTEGKSVHLWPIFDGFEASDLTFVGPNDVPFENGISITGGRDLVFDNIGGRNIGAGVITAQYCEGVVLNRCWGERSIITQQSYGPAFNFAECRGVVLNGCRTRGTRSFVNAEAASAVTIIAPLFENTMAPGSGVKVFSVGSTATISVRDAVIVGYGGFELAADNSQTGEEGRGHVYLSGYTRMQITSAPVSMPLRLMSGILDMQIAGVRTVYNLDRPTTWRRRIPLRNGMYMTGLGPRGLAIRGSVYGSPDLAGKLGTTVNAFYLGRSTDNGSNLIGIADGGGVVAGHKIEMGNAVAYNGSQFSVRTGDQAQILVSTASGSDLQGLDAFIEIEVQICEPLPVGAFGPGDLGAWTENDWRFQGGDFDAETSVFTAYDLASVPAASSGNPGTLAVSFAIPDMMQGDSILAVQFTGGMAGLSIVSAATANGSANIVFENATSTAIDRSATDVEITWARHQ